MTLIDHPPIEPAKPKQRVKATSQVMEVAQPMVPVLAPASSLLDVIARAGSDPNFDVDKFRALVQIQREEQDRQDRRAERDAELEAEAAFNAALTVVQGKMGRVKATLTNSQTHSVYADYAALDRMLRPLYVGAGFGLSFDTEDSPLPEHVRVVCFVTHAAPGAKRSHTRKYHVDMPADGKGPKGNDVMTRTHAAGSAYTYGQRYLLKMIFNIAVSKDDDGVAAGDTTAASITALQLQELEKLIADVNADPVKVFTRYGKTSLAELTVENFQSAKAKLETMRVPL